MRNIYLHPKLKEAKQRGIHLIASDIDWTLRDPSDPRYELDAVQSLICRIKKSGLQVMLLTGRDASLRRDFLPGLISQMNKHKIESPIYFGCANGISLYQVNGRNITTIYENDLTFRDIQKCLTVISLVQKKHKLRLEDYQNRAVDVFQKFLSSVWKDILPQRYIALAKKLGGTIFVESSKISLALPKNTSVQRSYISTIKRKIGPSFTLKGDQEFAHISRAYVDGKNSKADKLFALNFVCDKLNINLDQVAVFGGALDEIDRRMLKHCKYGFTNQQEYKSTNDKTPPFKLSGNVSPVALVHKAINYLIS